MGAFGTTCIGQAIVLYYSQFHQIKALAMGDKMGLFDDSNSVSPPRAPSKVNAIGFRAEARAMNWAIVTREGGSLILIKADTQDLPTTFDEAKGLEWCRKRLHQIVDQHRPAVAGVRYPEPSAMKSNVKSTNERIRMEGVILESLASKGISIVTGALTTIKSILGSESAKAYLKRDDLRGLNWKGLPANRKEAIMVAVAALEKEEKRGAHGNQE